MFRRSTLFFIFLVMAATASAGQLKVATVNMMKLLNEFHEKKTAEEVELVDLEDIKKNDQDRVSAIEAIIKELQMHKREYEDTSLSPEKRASIAAEANEKQATLAALQKERDEFLKRRRRELNEKMLGLINDIRTKVEAAVKAYAATQDVDFVFDESGVTNAQVPFLVYVRNRIDLTDAVLQILNKDAPPAGKPKTDSPK